MKRQARTVSDQLRQAIKASGVSKYRICKDTGIDQAQLSRFMGGTKGLSLDSLEQLCSYLGLELSPRKGR